MNGLWVLLRRELGLAFGRGGGPLLACAFFACAVTLTPLAVGPDPQKLRSLAAGITWLALALSTLLSLERMFERDLEDGGLDLLALGPAPLEAVALVKVLAHWAAAGAPLALAAPVAALALGAPLAVAPWVFLAALVGGLGFSAVGGLGAALALGARRGGVLVAVIVLPLFAPPVIFGAGALDGLASGVEARAGLLLMSAYVLAALALSPFAMAAAVRNALG